MSFNQITKTTKNYLKECLLLSEAGSNPPVPPVKYIPPGRLIPGQGSPGVHTIPIHGKPGTILTTRKTSTGTKGAGIGGTVYMPSITPNINYTSLVGQTLVPGTFDKGKDGSVTQYTDALLARNASLTRAQAGLETLSDLLDSVPSLKLLMAQQMMGAPTPSKGGSPTTTGSLPGTQGLPAIAKTVVSQIQNQIGLGGGGMLAKDPLAKQIFKFSMDRAKYDPTDPLAGMKEGLALLGAPQMLKATKQVSRTQMAGAATTAGHPSGMGQF